MSEQKLCIRDKEYNCRQAFKVKKVWPSVSPPTLGGPRSHVHARAAAVRPSRTQATRFRDGQIRHTAGAGAELACLPTYTCNALGDIRSG